MSSFAELALLMLTATATPPVTAASNEAPYLGAYVGARAPVDTVPVSSPLAARVSAAVADRWTVAASAVQLEWGAFAGAPLGDDTPFRLMGRGSDGWFAVVFEPAGGAPVAVRIRAGVRDTVAVAARPVGSDATLRAEDLRVETRVRWGPPARTRPERGREGWVTRRSLATGDVLATPAVAPPRAVHAGEPVRVVWSRGMVTISLEGTASSDAAVGEPVSVRLSGRPGRRQGVATGPGTVRIDL